MAQKNSLSLLFIYAVIIGVFYSLNLIDYSEYEKSRKTLHDVKSNLRVNESLWVGEKNIVKKIGENEYSPGVQRFVVHSYEEARNKSDTKFDPRARILEMKIFTERFRKRMKTIVPVYESQFMKEVEIQAGVLPGGLLRLIKKWKWEPDAEGGGGTEFNSVEAIFASMTDDWTMYRSIEGFRRTGKRKRVSRLVDPRPRPKDALLIYTTRRFYETKDGIKYIKYVMPKNV